MATKFYDSGPSRSIILQTIISEHQTVVKDQTERTFFEIHVFKKDFWSLKVPFERDWPPNLYSDEKVS